MADRRTTKRPLPDEEGGETTVEKKPRFPKGKKLRRDGVDGGGVDEAFGQWMNPQLAAKERAKRRNQAREAELLKSQEDISSAEIQYEDTANFVDDGIQLEPFNLKQEREEGYFDANGNFVEYANRNEIKDAWLDSVEVYSRFAEKTSEDKTTEDKFDDLSQDDIGKIKRNIANVLQPGETIIQALKRLKGTPSGRKEKMSEGTKRIFDQLTEDAMKLLESGEYNVYHEEREIFEREAEGYELLARAREGHAILDTRLKPGVSSNGKEDKSGNQSIGDKVTAAAEVDLPAGQASSSDGGDNLDMFGEEEDGAPDEGVQTDRKHVVSTPTSQQNPQVDSELVEPSNSLNFGEPTGGGVASDYIYDQASGYYYSSSLGYYYDPNTGLYCCATTGTWYSFDEETGAYVECQSAASAQTDAA